MAQAKELPHDLLAEKSFLACLLLDSSAYNEIVDIGISQDDFYHPQYAVLFETLYDLILENSPIDYVTVSSKLKSKGKLEALGGRDFLIDLSESQASSANIFYYAKIVKDKSNLRNIIRTASKVAQDAFDFDGNADDFISQAESNFFKLTNQAKSGKMISLKSVLKSNIKSIEDTSRKKGEISGLQTGFTRLDEYLLGMQPGQLIIIAGRPGSGKSVLALNLAVNVALMAHLPVAIFSLEMMAEELGLRILTGRAKVDATRLKRKELQDMDFRNIARAMGELSNIPLSINDSSNVTILDIQAQCRKIKAEQGLGLVVVDYIQLMRSHTSNPSREQQIAEISRGLKLMAKELECPVIALSQLNRSVETRQEKRPTTADLRESGSIEQDADVVLLIYRDELYNPDSKDKGQAEIIVGKNRAGAQGVAKLAWLGNFTTFENLYFESAQEKKFEKNQ